MPQIYEVINLYNQEKGILPYKYIGSDQNDNANYFGSSAELKNDIKRIGKEFFIKKTLKFFDNIENKTLRKIESDILKENRVKDSLMFYNKNENYSPGCGVKGMKHKNKKIVSEAWKESRKGWKPSSGTRNLWKEQRKNRLVSEETKQKMSELNARYFSNVSGENHPVTGYKHSNEERKKRSEKMKERMKDKSLRGKVSDRMSQQWLVVDPLGNNYQITNLLSWCRETNNNYSTVYRQMKGWKCQKV